MLLPVFAIGVTCAYVIFNKNAYKSFSETNIESSINITDIGNYTVGQQYQLNYKQNLTTGTNTLNFSYISLTAGDLNINQSDYESLTKWWLNSNGRLYFSNTSQSFITYLNVNNNEFLQFNFIGEITQDWLNQFTINRVVLTTDKLDNVFYYSIDKVTQSPYFSWAYDSFLVAPFTYIVTLFSMPVDSPIVMLLSYWLDISIVWLVFDLIMYLPLLVHRWLDKGVLE